MEKMKRRRFYAVVMLIAVLEPSPIFTLEWWFATFAALWIASWLVYGGWPR